MSTRACGRAKLCGARTWWARSHPAAPPPPVRCQLPSSPQHRRACNALYGCAIALRVRCSLLLRHKRTTHVSSSDFFLNLAAHLHVSICALMDDDNVEATLASNNRHHATLQRDGWGALMNSPTTIWIDPMGDGEYHSDCIGPACSGHAGCSHL